MFCCRLIKSCVIPVLVSFFLLSYTLFWLWAHFYGWRLTNRKKPIEFQDVEFYADSFEKKKKKIKNNHYSRSLLDPENWWCTLAQFEKFEQIWGAVKGRTLKWRKRFENSICLPFQFSTYLLLPIFTLHAKFEKKYMPAKPQVVQNWGKMGHWAEPTTGTSFGNFIYTTSACNDTPLS